MKVTVRGAVVFAWRGEVAVRRRIMRVKGINLREDLVFMVGVVTSEYGTK